MYRKFGAVAMVEQTVLLLLDVGELRVAHADGERRERIFAQLLEANQKVVSAPL